MNAKDLLNNSTLVAFIPAEQLAEAAETGLITDLKGMGRKILMIINAGIFTATAELDVVVQESNVPTFAIAGTETLDAAMTATQRTLVLQTGEGDASFPQYDFNLLIESEIVTVTERIGDTFYIKRGQQGTTAATHADDTAVTLQIDTLHTFAQITAAAVVEADLAPNKRYVRVVATVGGAGADTVDVGIVGVIYLERAIPSGI